MVPTDQLPGFHLSRGRDFYVVSLTPVFIAILAIHVWRSLTRTNVRKLPQLPSPPKEPFFGHARAIPMKESWLTFSRWHKKYGDAVLVRLFGQPMVILNSVEAAHELLEKKSTNFSNRPAFRFFRDWLGWEYFLPFMPYNENNRKQRKIMRPHLSSQAITKHHPVMYKHAQKLLDNLKEDPDKFLSHIYNFLSNVMVKIIYGYETTSESDPMLTMVRAVGRYTTEVEMTTVMLLDLLPFLAHLPSWLPWMGAKRKAKVGSKLRQEMAEQCLAYTMSIRGSQNQDPCVMLQVLDDLDKESGDVVVALQDSETKKNVMHIGAGLYVGGVDTSTSTLATFLVAMMLHPHVAKRAQRDIDQITGGPGVRLPRFDDRKNLPYIDCILKEIFRWNPPGPLGLFHQSTKADEYKGMEIPANSSIVTNIWFMCHDETQYPSPSKFNPDRFLQKVTKSEKVEVGSIPGTEDPTRVVFGFGRRTCPGEHMADAMLWTVITYILAVFDINPPLDPITGKPDIPEVKFTGGTTSYPERFKCAITPRKFV